MIEAERRLSYLKGGTTSYAINNSGNLLEAKESIFLS